jgi:hypothetical protein
MKPGQISWILLILGLSLVVCSRGEGPLSPGARLVSILNFLGFDVINGTDDLGNDYGEHITITGSKAPGEY